MPNIVLITVDCLRPDALQAMPFVQELQGKSMVYENFYTPSPWTLGSLASWYTGLYPSSHMIDNGPEDNLKVSSQLTLLPGILRQHGYTTALLSSNPYITRGLDREIDHFRFIAGPGIEKTKADALVCVEALEILEDIHEPFFMHIHLNEAHPPYLPEGPYRPPGLSRDEMLSINQDYHFLTGVEQPLELMMLLYRLYLGDCTFVDTQIKRVYEVIPEGTHFIVSADHGIGFDEHDIVAMNFGLWEELIHIPCIWHVPGGGQCQIEDYVQTTQFAGSVLWLLGLPVPEPMRATGHLAAFAELKPPTILYDRLDRRYPDSEKKDRLKFHEQARSIVTLGHKLLVLDDRELLFDLRVDPHELYPLDGGPDLAGVLDTVTEQAAEYRVEIETTDDDEIVLNRLRELGYVE